MKILVFLVLIFTVGCNGQTTTRSDTTANGSSQIDRNVNVLEAKNTASVRSDDQKPNMKVLVTENGESKGTYLFKGDEFVKFESSLTVIDNGVESDTELDDKIDDQLEGSIDLLREKGFKIKYPDLISEEIIDTAALSGIIFDESSRNGARVSKTEDGNKITYTIKDYNIVFRPAFSKLDLSGAGFVTGYTLVSDDGLVAFEEIEFLIDRKKTNEKSKITREYKYEKDLLKELEVVTTHIIDSKKEIKTDVTKFEYQSL